MTRKIRQEVYDKFGGLCAYTGKPLGEDWQVDHIKPRAHWYWKQNSHTDDVNDFENLLPAIKIINHYKRDHNLESFRLSMIDFHKRLAKLPKKTMRPATVRRIAYMNKVAELFGITTDRPFTGKFYFEILK